MDRQKLRQLVITKLTGIAPEVDPAQIVPDLDLRRQIDLDSMDFLNFIIALSKDLKVEIPETDYSKMSTLDASVDYLTKLAEKQSTGKQVDERTA